MTKKSVKGRTLVALLVAGLTATVEPAIARSMDEINETKELRVCVANANLPDGEVKPEGCRGECEFGGVVGDMVEAFAKAHGWSSRYWVSNWDELFQNADGVTIKEGAYTPASMALGRCDIIGSPLVRLDWRLKKMDMTCFFPSRMVVVVRKDRANEFKSAKDLIGKSVTVEKSMSLHTWIEEQNQTDWQDNPVKIVFRPYEESIRAVDNGDVDFTVVAVLDALWQTRHQLDKSAVAFAVGPIDEGCWAYEKGANEMGELIKTYYDNEQANPESELNRIWKAYYGLSFAEFVRLVSVIK